MEIIKPEQLSNAQALVLEARIAKALIDAIKAFSETQMRPGQVMGSNVSNTLKRMSERFVGTTNKAGGQ